MKVLVTGATGFLGTTLCAELKRVGHEVTALGSKDADLRKAGSLSKWSNTKFDRIFHLAAWTQAGDFCLFHQGEQWIINQEMNTNVLRWWHESQPQAKLISMGTSCAYDEHLPLSEDNYLTGKPIESLFSYAMTKRMLQVGVQSLNKQFGLNYLTLVPSTLYGREYHTDGRQMHFIFDLMRKILRAKYFGEKVILWGDGYQKRELVYVDDFVRAALLLDQTCDNEIVNIGAGEEHTIREFAETICKLVDYPFSKIEFDTSKYVGARSKCLNVDLMRKKIPGLTLTPLQDGLQATVAWFKKVIIDPEIQKTQGSTSAAH